MTLVVCLKCGVFKKRAFSACPQCGFRPRSKADLASAMCATDLSCGPGDLKRLSANIKAGRSPSLDERLLVLYMELLESEEGKIALRWLDEFD